MIRKLRDFLSRHSYFGPRCIIADAKIGRFCSIAADVWIGTKAVIRDGVTIGHGCVIGAGAVVTKDTEPYGIYVGVPAKLTRYRFSPEIREKLMSLQWWEKDFAWIRSRIADFQDVDRLAGLSEGS